MKSVKKIAVIGLDTSHTAVFTKLIQGAAPDGGQVKGMRVVKAMRFPSAFQAEEGQDKRQAEFETLGVEMMPDVESVLKDVDAVFIEINDPALHVHYFEKIVHSGLPVFIDKPLAGNVNDARRIVELAEKHDIKVWSASSLRFLPQLISAKKRIPAPDASHTFGALGKAAAGSDLIWYGVHAVEMLTATLGTGAQSVQAMESDAGVVMTIAYADGRSGLVECLRGCYHYGGRLQAKGEIVMYTNEKQSPYPGLISALQDFVVKGNIPVPLSEAFEIVAILEAADRSLTSRQREYVTH